MWNLIAQVAQAVLVQIGLAILKSLAATVTAYVEQYGKAKGLDNQQKLALATTQLEAAALKVPVLKLVADQLPSHRSVLEEAVKALPKTNALAKRGPDGKFTKAVTK